MLGKHLCLPQGLDWIIGLEGPSSRSYEFCVINFGRTGD